MLFLIQRSNFDLGIIKLQRIFAPLLGKDLEI
jgi:hypothetical protein